MESQCVKAESAELMPVNGSLLLRPVSAVAVDEVPFAPAGASRVPRHHPHPPYKKLDDAALPFQVHGLPSVAEWLVRQPYGDLAAL